MSFKIAIAHLDLSEPMGDTRCVSAFVRALRNIGHDVAVYTPVFDPGPFREEWRGIPVNIIEQNIPLRDITKFIASPSPLGKIIGKLKARRWSLAAAKSIALALPADLDILDCHNWYSYRIAKFYRKINPRCRILWTMHDPPSNYRPKNKRIMDFLSRTMFYLEPFLERPYYRHIDGTIVMDKWSVPIAKRCGPPVFLLYLGVDFPHFEHKPQIKEEFKNGAVTVLGVGALSPYRRFEDIVETVSILRKKGKDARAVIVCRDVWKDRAYRKSFEEFVEHSGAAEYVSLNFDGLEEADLLRAFRDADIFVFPNHIEIWGLAAFEAMASGLPLIVSDVTSAAEVLSDGENALFVAPLRPDQISERVEELMNDSARYLKIAEAGQKFVRENLSWDAYAKGFLRAAHKEQ